MSLFIDVFRESTLITGLVMVMLLLIEFIHIYSKGRSFSALQKQPFKQILLAALFGLVPGCIGGFAAVSLYTHRIISFGALVAMMISTMGDEAFFLFASVPKIGLLLLFLLFSLALLLGWITDKWTKRYSTLLFIENHYTLHKEEGCIHGSHSAVWGRWRENLLKLNSKRTLLMVGLLLFILGMGLGLLEHDSHEGEISGSLHIFSERWLNLLFTVLSVITLFLTLKASNHFVSEHLWGHIIKKHFLKIFLWTFGAILFISIGLHFFHLDKMIVQNGYLFLLLAAFIGLIPESGPHLIFIALYASGMVPFSILFTNFFIQDGHTALPLLAENKSAFVKAKAIKFIIGLAIGTVIYACGA